jgi:hypothetical protein
LNHWFTFSPLFSGFENGAWFNGTHVLQRVTEMIVNKPQHLPLILTVMTGMSLLLMPLWLITSVAAAAALIVLGTLIHRHWDRVCCACQVASEFFGFCLLVMAFVGLSLGLSALVDISGS